MNVKMKLRIITKNHAADPEIEFVTKSISKPFCRATAIPTAWELIMIIETKIFRFTVTSKTLSSQHSNVLQQRIHLLKKRFFEKLAKSVSKLHF